MNILLDTCAFIYLAGNNKAIPEKTLDTLLDSENNVFISSISAWEIMLKESVGKPVFTKASHLVISDIKNLYSISTLPFTEEDAFKLGSLVPIHKDPFDRMIICQALSSGLPVVTDDSTFSQYPIKILW